MLVKPLWAPSHRSTTKSKSFQEYFKDSVEDGIGLKDRGDSGKDIGSRLGRVLEVDKRSLQVKQAKFMRVRIKMPIDKPLRRGGNITKTEGERCSIIFRYERLPTFCYICGILGHDDKHCHVSHMESLNERQYGEWLRARSVVISGNEKGNGWDDGSSNKVKGDWSSSRPEGMVENSGPSVFSKDDVADGLNSSSGLSVKKAVSFKTLTKDPISNLNVGDSLSGWDKVDRAAHGLQVGQEARLEENQTNISLAGGLSKLWENAKEKGEAQEEDMGLKGPDVGNKRRDCMENLTEAEGRVQKKKEITVNVQSYSDRHIDAIITEDSGFKWRITGFYENPEVHRRKESWDLLKALSKKFQLPWLCFGDFNEIALAGEKWGELEDLRDRWMILGKQLIAEWSDHYKDMRIHHLVEFASDHCALLITDSIVSQRPRKRRIQFEAMWTRRDDYRDIIRVAWNDSVNLYNPNGMVMGLRQCADELSRWNKSKVQWMSLGDRNTKYFHTKASGRKKKNTISKLMDDRGIWRESTLEVAEVAVSYFENLYMTSHPERILEVVEAVDPKVSDEMNQILIKQFIRDEIEAALKQMHPTKSPGRDSFKLMHYLDHKRDGRDCYMAIKLDISKVVIGWNGASLNRL
uniref:Zinc knuckle CX2CX4HX4C domain-containing protein n=1 Tax=Quercus lobata TaxID=97700 RepID=A0A7N2LGY8_QUELO